MVIIPNRFVFLATPRTGSRAISEALMRKYPDAITDYPSNHHDPAPDDNKLLVYTAIRDPLDQMLSWWAHVDVRNGSKRRPVQFAAEYENIMYLPKNTKYRLNIHVEQADVFLKFEDVAYALSLDDIEVVGRSEYSVTHEEKVYLQAFLEEEYHWDMHLWYKAHV